MKRQEVKALLKMMEAMIVCQIHGEKAKALTLIDEAWKEFDKKERPAVFDERRHR